MRKQNKTLLQLKYCSTIKLSETEQRNDQQDWLPVFDSLAADYYETSYRIRLKSSGHKTNLLKLECPSNQYSAGQRDRDSGNQIQMCEGASENDSSESKNLLRNFHRLCEKDENIRDDNPNKRPRPASSEQSSSEIRSLRIVTTSNIEAAQSRDNGDRAGDSHNGDKMDSSLIVRLGLDLSATQSENENSKTRLVRKATYQGNSEKPSSVGTAEILASAHKKGDGAISSSQNSNSLFPSNISLSVGFSTLRATTRSVKAIYL